MENAADVPLATPNQSGAGNVQRHSSKGRLAQRLAAVNKAAPVFSHRRLYMRQVWAQEKLRTGEAFETGAVASEDGKLSGASPEGAKASVLQRIYAVKPQMTRTRSARRTPGTRKGEGEGLAGTLGNDASATPPGTSPSEARAGTLGSAKDGSTPSTRTSQYPQYPHFANHFIARCAQGQSEDRDEQEKPEPDLQHRSDRRKKPAFGAFACGTGSSRNPPPGGFRQHGIGTACASQARKTDLRYTQRLKQRAACDDLDADEYNSEALGNGIGGRGNHAIRTQSGAPSTSADERTPSELLTGGKQAKLRAQEITEYEMSAGGNRAAFPSSPSLQSGPLMRKDQIVAARKGRIAQSEAQAKGDEVDAPRLSRRSEAVGNFDGLRFLCSRHDGSARRRNSKNPAEEDPKRATCCIRGWRSAYVRNARPQSLHRAR